MRWKLPTAVALVAVVSLAAGGALVGLVVQGPVGLVIGGAIGGLAGVAAGYVPIFRDRAERRRAELEQSAARRVEARERLAAASVPELDGLVAGPSFLLRPELAVVKFTGRDTELAELRAWCQMDDPRSVRVVAGAGGVGKTRLALEIGAEWNAEGRELIVVAAGEEAQVLGLARAVTSGPVLLVVDYAETRAGLRDLLRAVATDPGPVRVLLLARSLDEWWDKLAEESSPPVAQLLAATTPIRLEAPIGDPPDADLAAAAVPFFAAKLGVPPPGGVFFDLPARRVPVLVLHGAALVAVLRSMTGQPGPPRRVATEGVLGELLRHEAGYWRRSAAICGLREDGRVLKAVVAAAILLGADDLDEAAVVAGRVPDLVGYPAGELRRWARWLFDLYPAGPGGRLGSVQPDLLAEHHAASQLTASAALAKAILRDLTPSQAERALTVLARAWELHQDVGQVIEAALRADLTRLAIPAAEVAVQTQAKVGELLASALGDSPVARGQLLQIEQALPHPSVVLAQAKLAVTLRIMSELPPGDGIDQWTSGAVPLLSQVGRPAEALPLLEKAVATYRDLAAAGPRVYRPYLAGSLHDLSACLSELDRPADALPPAEEAVTIFREVTADRPGFHLSSLAASLTGLSARLSALGRPADALGPAEEAVAIRQELAADIPSLHRPGLAISLTGLSFCLSALGRPADALGPAEEAVTIRRELASAEPDQYRHDLARSLQNLGSCFSALGRMADALPPTREAVTIRRELAAAMPDQYRASLADSLDALGRMLLALDRPADALGPAEEAVAIRRGLASATPDRYRPELAASLTGLSFCLSVLDRPADALGPAEEAVAIRRGLASATPDRYRPELAASLSSLSTCFGALDRPADALPPAEEAVAILRELAATMSDQYRPSLAYSLGDLSVCLAELGHLADALPLAEDAVAAYRELTAAMPDLYRPGLAASLASLSLSFSELGRTADALGPAEEAVAIFRDLAAAMPDQYRASLAASLNNLSDVLSTLNRSAEAIAALAEAQAISEPKR